MKFPFKSVRLYVQFRILQIVGLAGIGYYHEPIISLVVASRTIDL